MKRKLFAVIAATTLTFASVAAIAPVPSSDAAIIYECRKWTWWAGWRVVITTDYKYFQNAGYTCYCIGVR